MTKKFFRADNLRGIDVDDVYATFVGVNGSIEKFYATLPEAAGDYKVDRRPIVVEGAMNLETEIFVRALKNPVTYRELNYLFVAGTYKNYPVAVVRTEMGAANSAASTALAIKKFNPVAVINQGTAGGHDGALNIGTIVLGERSINVGAVKTLYSAAGAGIDVTRQESLGTYAYDDATKIFQPHKEFFADKTLLAVAQKVSAAHKNFNVAVGTISSTDTWNNAVDYINFLHENYGSSCEEMETNAAAQICHNAGVPFLGVRVLSNNITNGDEFSDDAAKTCQDFVLLVVENYIRDVLKE